MRKLSDTRTLRTLIKRALLKLLFFTTEVNLYFSNMFKRIADLSKETMVGHGKSTEVLLFDVGKGIGSKEPHLETFTIMDFKYLKDYDKNFRIYTLKVHYEKPHLIFIGTNQGIFIISSKE